MLKVRLCLLAGICTFMWSVQELTAFPLICYCREHLSGTGLHIPYSTETSLCFHQRPHHARCARLRVRVQLDVMMALLVGYGVPHCMVTVGVHCMCLYVCTVEPYKRPTSTYQPWA